MSEFPAAAYDNWKTTEAVEEPKDSFPDNPNYKPYDKSKLDAMLALYFDSGMRAAVLMIVKKWLTQEEARWREVDEEMATSLRQIIQNRMRN